MIELIQFLIKYTPFWSIPLGIISVQFAYIFWLKDLRPTCILFALIGSFCFVVLVIYFWTGGPDKSVDFLIKVEKNIKDDR